MTLLDRRNHHLFQPLLYHVATGILSEGQIAVPLRQVLPRDANVRVEVRDGGTAIDYGWDFDRTMVSNHDGYQIDGHPLRPRPPIKLHNY